MATETKELFCFDCNRAANTECKEKHRTELLEVESMSKEQQMVGRAFRCADGLIRWITHLSTRNYYSLLWLNETEGVWYSGGIVKANKWEGGEEVPAPQPGESYRIAGATGVIRTFTPLAEKES